MGRLGGSNIVERAFGAENDVGGSIRQLVNVMPAHVR